MQVAFLPQYNEQPAKTGGDDQPQLFAVPEREVEPKSYLAVTIDHGRHKAVVGSLIFVWSQRWEAVALARPGELDSARVIARCSGLAEAKAALILYLNKSAEPSGC